MGNAIIKLRPPLEDNTIVINTCESATLQVLANEAENFQIFGLTFDPNKCFLLPFALPGIKKLTDFHVANPQHRVLIVGHDGSDEEFKGVEIAYFRAKTVLQFLQKKVDEWVAWFEPSKPKHVRWGLREVQLMLSVLPKQQPPYYIGMAGGVMNAKTQASIKQFQKDQGLAVDGLVGPITKKALVTAYMDLNEVTLPEGLQSFVHGCEGSFEDELPTRGIYPESRVLEVFFFKEDILPEPEGQTSSTTELYQQWKDAVINKNYYQYHGINIQILDKNKKAFSRARVIAEGPTKHISHSDEEGFVFFSGLQKGEYTIRVVDPGGQVVKTSSLTYPTAKVLRRSNS